MAAERTIKRATLSSSIKAAEIGTEKDPAE